MAESVLKVRRRGSQVWLSCLVVIGPSPRGVSLRCLFVKNDSGECHCVILFLSVQACRSPKWVVWSLMCILPSYALASQVSRTLVGWSLTSDLRCYGFFHSLLYWIPFPSLFWFLSFPQNSFLCCLIPRNHCNILFLIRIGLKFIKCGYTTEPGSLKMEWINGILGSIFLEQWRVTKISTVFHSPLGVGEVSYSQQNLLAPVLAEGMPTHGWYSGTQCLGKRLNWAHLSAIFHSVSVQTAHSWEGYCFHSSLGWGAL